MIRDGRFKRLQQRRARAVDVLTRKYNLGEAQINALILFASGNTCADLSVATDEILDAMQDVLKDIGSLLFWWQEEDGSWSIVIAAPGWDGQQDPTQRPGWTPSVEQSGGIIRS